MNFEKIAPEHLHHYNGRFVLVDDFGLTFEGFLKVTPADRRYFPDEIEVVNPVLGTKGFNHNLDFYVMEDL